MTNEIGIEHPWFGVPPTKEPRQAADVPTLIGKRVILSTPDGFIYDMRAVSDQYTDIEGRTVVDVASEEGYFRWMFLRERPQKEPWAVYLVWIE